MLICISKTQGTFQVYTFSSYLIIYSTIVARQLKTNGYIWWVFSDFKLIPKKSRLKGTNVTCTVTVHGKEKWSVPFATPGSPSAECVSPESSASAWRSSSSSSAWDHCRLCQDNREALAGTPGSMRQDMNVGLMVKRTVSNIFAIYFQQIWQYWQILVTYDCHKQNNETINRLYSVDG